jgi:hypothetical protein
MAYKHIRIEPDDIEGHGLKGKFEDLNRLGGDDPHGGRH